jgi:hypothetical protein
MVYDLNDLKEKYYVVHNIDGLKEGFLGEQGIDFRKYCEDLKMEVYDFFCKEYQIEFTAAVREKYDRNCLVIIDECHEWFDKNKRPLKMWLSYHRHLNQEIWLVAHRSTNLPSVYRSFIEVEYRAKSGSFIALPGYFLYNRILGGERVGYTVTRKKQEVFKLYKSQDKGFKKKRVSMLIPATAILSIAGVMYFFVIPQRVIGKHIKEVEKKDVKVENVKEESVKSQQDWRYVGVIGKTVMLEDANGKTVALNEIPGRFLVLEVSGSEYVKLYDIDKRKEWIVKAYKLGQSVNRSTVENGKPMPD